MLILNWGDVLDVQISEFTAKFKTINIRVKGEFYHTFFYLFQTSKTK